MADHQATHFLSGWKEIAIYLHKAARTCQPYEREVGLPILRPAGRSAPALMAVQDELDQWVSAPHLRFDSATKRRALRSRTNHLRADFLQLDSEIALTFTGTALTTGDLEKKRRTAQIARNAYRTILGLRKETDLSKAERDKLEANLRQLKSELRRLDHSS